MNIVSCSSTSRLAKIATEFTEMVGVDYPIIGAPMFLVTYEELAIAVAKAGGLGALPLVNYLEVEELRKALRRIRQETDKPIGVNIQLHTKYEWKEQFGLCLEAGVKFFIASFGDPRLILDDVDAVSVSDAQLHEAFLAEREQARIAYALIKSSDFTQAAAADVTDEQVRVRLGKDEVRPHAVEVEKYVPAPRRARVRPESAR